MVILQKYWNLSYQNVFLNIVYEYCRLVNLVDMLNYWSYYLYLCFLLSLSLSMWSLFASLLVLCKTYIRSCFCFYFYFTLCLICLFVLFYFLSVLFLFLSAFKLCQCCCHFRSIYPNSVCSFLPCNIIWLNTVHLYTEMILTPK